MSDWELFRSCTVKIDGGSGCIVNIEGDDCFIFTAKHVVEGKEPGEIKIASYEDIAYQANRVYLHDKADAAILHITNKGLKGVKAMDIIPELGQEFILYGYPAHRRDDPDQTEELSNLTGKIQDYIEKNCEVVGQTDNFTLQRFALGFSGGGVFFLKDDKTLFLIGIQSKMDSDAPGRIRFVPVSAFQKIIKTYGLEISIAEGINEVNENEMTNPHIPKIKEFIALQFNSDNDFADLCWKLKINNTFSGDFENRAFHLIRKMEREYSDPYKRLYEALVTLRQNFKIEINSIFNIQ